jgi:hypothetical protein
MFPNLAKENHCNHYLKRCPAKENVSCFVLPAGYYKNIDSIVLLSELTIPAIDLIISLLLKIWFKGLNGKQVRVGLPMGLRILYASLSDNLLTHDALLSKAEGNNHHWY